jgi:UDP-N-acetylglucosamine acyltransferase
MIHATAVIEKGAELGANVSVGPFSYIQSDTKVGDGSVIGSHVTILRYTTMGERCRVHAGAVLGDDPQDKAFKGVQSWVKIGSDCVLREGVTVHRGTKEGTITDIGDGCFLMAFSHYAHNVKVGRNVVVANGAMLGGYVEIGDGAFISGNVCIHQFVRIGRLAMLGGGSGISKDVPPFCLVRPVALNEVVGLNVVGLRRAGMSVAEREAIHKAFHILYQSGLNVSQAVEAMRTTNPSGAAAEFCAFIETSTRGICAKE